MLPLHRQLLSLTGIVSLLSLSLPVHADWTDMLVPMMDNLSKTVKNGPSGAPVEQSQGVATGPSKYVADELLIKFKPAIQNPGKNPLAQAIINRVQARLQERLGNSNWVRVKLPANQSLQQALAQLRTQADVEYAEPNFVLHANIIPNDPAFRNLWGLHNTGQSGKADVDIDAPEAWERFSPAGNTVIVAVIDSGVDHQHPDLRNRIWANSQEIAGNGADDDRNGYIDDVRGWDFVSNDNNPMDDNSHGTHVAGTIAASANNATGIVGVAGPANVKIMPLKFLDANGSGLTSNAIKALDYATAQGAVISNNSWGGGSYSKALYDALVRNQNAGRLFVASAGNNGQNTDTTPQYPQAYDIPNIISVASATSADTLSSFSNYGKQSVDLAAPGSFIYSTVNGGGYGNKSGTSMASPHVAGAAALLWAHHKSLTHTQIKNILMSSVRKATYLESNTVSGGMLNLEKALLAAGGGNTPAPEPTPEPTPTPVPATKPATPTSVNGLLGSNNGQSAIRLSWTDNASNETGQEIWISTNGSNYQSLARISANTTQYIHAIGTIPKSAYYYYKVRAYNNLGYSSFSTQARVATSGAGGTPTPTPSDKPAMPTNLTGQPSAITEGGVIRRSVKIGWSDNASNETGQEIWISFDGLNYKLLARFGSNVTTYTHDIGTVMNSDYFYKVRTYNSAGFSTFSNGLRVRKF